MKKIFRMALVFALAGATLMYTGCTKDYSEEINGLGSDVATLNSSLQALQQDLNSLKSSVSALETAYKAADDALKTSIEANASAIAKNASAIADNASAIADNAKAIDALKADVANGATAIKALQDKVAANETAIQNLENAAKTHATKDELNAAIKGVEGDLATLKTEITAKVDALQGEVDAIKTQISGITAALAKKANQADVDAAISQLQKDIEAALKGIEDKINEAYGYLSNELRSIVFLPDFYFAGIEATSFTTSTINPIEAVTDEVKFESNGTSFVLPKGAKSDWTAQLKADKKTPVSYELSQLNVANYDINPSTFNVEDAEWALFGMDREYVVKAEAAKTWAPVFEGIAVKDDIAEVSFSIANPELLIASITDREKTNVPVMQLVATLEDGKTVSSDWEAIVPDQIQFKELAFFTPKDAKEADYKTVRTSCDIKNKDLYATAQKALEALKDPEANYGGASVPVYYNCGEFDLTNLVNIHMVKDGKVIEKTLDELVAKYPDLAMNFELVDYTIGDNKTSESMYGKIEGKTFYPCYVKTGDKPSQELCGTDGQGKSSIGRFPLVLVTLTNDKDVVLSGYFVIELTEEEIPAGKDVQEFTIKDFGSFPYICAAQKDSTTWDEFSDLVLEKLNKSYNEFIKTYKIMTPNGAVELQQGNTYTAQLFVKTVDEEGNEKYEIAYELDEEGEPTTTPVDFGTVTYKVDKKGNGVNDKFVWEITKAAAENIGEGQDVYVLFQISEFSQIYFKFSAAIAAPAEITYGEINPAYWFNDVEAKAQNTVRANVIVPKTGSEDVTVFKKNLNDYFINNVLKVKLAEASEAVYAKYFDGKDGDDMKLTYAYSFAADQPVIKNNGKEYVLCTNEAGTSLYTAAVDANGKLIKVTAADKKERPSLIDKTGKYLLGMGIANFDATGDTLIYLCNDYSKELLNFWGKEEKDNAKMLYANIQVDIAAGDPATNCVIAEASDMFHIRFIRPVSVKGQSAKGLRDAVPGGDVIYLGDLINAIDWNDNEPDNMWSYKNNAFVADTYKTAAGKDIVWFNYYGFKTIKVDAANIKTDQAGKTDKDGNPLFELLGGPNGVNLAAEAYLAQLSGDQYVEVAGGVTGTLSAATTSPYKIAGLTDYVFYYANNEGCVNNFKLMVPVEITYSWGTLKADVIIPVTATYKEK